MTKYEQLRQFVSSFIQGKNSDALLNSLADELGKGENLSIAVTDQLTLSTASEEYLDKRMSELGITRPPELGMSDDAFRSMGIQINATKQISEVIHDVLNTFYGAEYVRAFAQSDQPEPYVFTDGDTLTVQFEDGSDQLITFKSSDFANINLATAQEIADTITRALRDKGLNSFALVERDFETDLKYVRIFGGAKGPYSMVKVTGGEAQNHLEFPVIRPTRLTSNTTVWEITKNIGSTLRFRWNGGPSPLLSKVITGDRVMIYGQGFTQLGLGGTFTVTNVRPPNPITAYDAGWFEIENTSEGVLKSSAPNVAPPPNAPGATYTFTVNQTSYQDLKFFLSQKNTAYSHRRYALAFEPRNDLLRIYLPATTRVVARNLIGGSHLHMLYPANDFDGSHGSATITDSKIHILSATSFKFKQQRADNYGTGGTASYSGPTVIPIDYVTREEGFTTVFTTIPHGLVGVNGWSTITAYTIGQHVTYNGFGYDATVNNMGFQPDISPTKWTVTGPEDTLSNTVVALDIDKVNADDEINTFLGNYMVDPETSYILTSSFVTIRESIIAGENKRTLFVKGVLQNEPGILLFDLNKETHESPVRYLAAQIQGSSTPVTIQTISQNGFNIVVTTQTAHGAIPGSSVIISGTATMNGVYDVISTPSNNSFICVSLVSQVQYETAGTSTVVASGATSTIILDPSYTFKKSHAIGADATLLSSPLTFLPEPDGSDYPLYVTGTAEARVFAAKIINDITALGIKLEVVVVYPSDAGLGNAGGSDNELDPPASEEIFVWGAS